MERPSSVRIVEMFSFSKTNSVNSLSASGVSSKYVSMAFLWFLPIALFIFPISYMIELICADIHLVPMACQFWPRARKPSNAVRVHMSSYKGLLLGISFSKVVFKKEGWGWVKGFDIKAKINFCMIIQKANVCLSRCIMGVSGVRFKLSPLKNVNFFVHQRLNALHFNGSPCIKVGRDEILKIKRDLSI